MDQVMSAPGKVQTRILRPGQHPPVRSSQGQNPEGKIHWGIILRLMGKKTPSLQSRRQILTHATGLRDRAISRSAGPQPAGHAGVDELQCHVASARWNQSRGELVQHPQDWSFRQPGLEPLRVRSYPPGSS